MTLSTTPMPWPDPQMSRHALAPLADWKFIASGPGAGEIVGVEPGGDDRGAQIIAVDRR